MEGTVDFLMHSSDASSSSSNIVSHHALLWDLWGSNLKQTVISALASDHMTTSSLNRSWFPTIGSLVIWLVLILVISCQNIYLLDSQASLQACCACGVYEIHVFTDIFIDEWLRNLTYHWQCEELWAGKSHLPRVSEIKGLSKLAAYSLSIMDGKRVHFPLPILPIFLLIQALFYLKVVYFRAEYWRKTSGIMLGNFTLTRRHQITGGIWIHTGKGKSHGWDVTSTQMGVKLLILVIKYGEGTSVVIPSLQVF